MKLLRRLIPPFLQRLDLRLQQRHPRLWSTRIHYHLWFLLLVDLVVSALGAVLEVTPRTSPDPEELFAYMMLPAVVYFACWVYRVVLFTVERRFGIRHFYAETGEFLVHLVSILLILTIPYNLAFTVAWRIGHTVDDATLIAHVDELDTRSPWFYGRDAYVSEGQDHADMGDAMDEAVPALRTQVDPWRHNAQGEGTHQFFHDLDEYAKRNVYDPSKVRTEVSLQELYEQYVAAYNEAADPEDQEHYDTAAAAHYLQLADSIETNFPLLQVRFGFYRPNYWPDDAASFLTDSLLEARYIQDQRTHAPPDRAALVRTMAAAHVYSAHVRELPVDTVLAEFARRTASTTGIATAGPRIATIGRAKDFHYGPMKWEVLLYLVGIGCFVMAMLVSIFKNIHWQPFLIMLVVMGLLPIVLYIFALLTEHAVFHISDERIMMWGYYLIAAVLLLALFRVPRLRTYRTYVAVTTILADLVLPFFAVFTVLLLHSEFDVFGVRAFDHMIDRIREADMNDPRLPALYAQLRALNEWVGNFILWMLWGGVALYALVLHPLMRNLYTRLMALPERK